MPCPRGRLSGGSAAPAQVYQRSLKVVQQLLPRPHLRAGPLLAAAPSTLRTPHERQTPARCLYKGALLNICSAARWLAVTACERRAGEWECLHALLARGRMPASCQAVRAAGCGAGGRSGGSCWTTRASGQLV